MNHRAFLETWFDRVWHREDLDAIHALMRPDATAHLIADAPRVGPDEFRAFAEALLALIGDVRVKIAHHIEDGDWSNALLDVTAKSRRDGSPIAFSGQVLVRITDGRIAEGHNHLDYIPLHEQLGLLPAGTLRRRLCGTALS